MNIYRYELKANYKFALIWLIAIIVVAFIVIGMYPFFSKDLADFTKILSNIPDSIKAAMGINLDNLGSILGYYSSFPMSIMMVCFSLEAMLLGLSILSKEARDKTTDFLYTKPVSRNKIITSKILAALTLVLISNIILIFILYLILLLFANTTFSFTTYLLLTLILLFLQLIFLAIGIFASAIMPKIKNVLPISMGTVFSIYILSAFSPDNFRLVLPFKYFNPINILLTTNYDAKYLYVSFLLILVLTLITYFLYQKKDIQAV